MYSSKWVPWGIRYVYDIQNFFPVRISYPETMQYYILPIKLSISVLYTAYEVPGLLGFCNIYYAEHLEVYSREVQYDML